MNNPEPSPPLDAAITGQRPLPADTGITGERPAFCAGNTPEALRLQAFLGWLKLRLQIYADIRARRAIPPWWGLVQLGCLVVGVVNTCSLFQLPFKATGNEHLEGLVFLGVFFGFAVVPTLLLRLFRRSRLEEVRQRLEEATRLTVQTYPAEIEQCGGMRILTDPVELEALVHVLENTDHLPPQLAQERWWTNK